MPQFTRFFSIGFAVFFSSFSFAGEISDPNDFLGKILSQKTKHSFEESFRIGDEATVQRFHQDCVYNCSGAACYSICKEINNDFQKKLLEKTDDDATVVYSDGIVENYVKADFDAYKGSLFQKNLSELDVFLGRNGTAILESLSSAPFLFADGTTVPAQVITGKFKTTDGDIPFEYTIGNDVPGSTEILFLKIMGEKIFKVKAISRVTSATPLLGVKP